MAVVTKHTFRSARACAALALAVPALVVMLPTAAHAEFSIGFDIRIGYAPPPLPVYEQPPLPGPDYIWVPGHWAWSDWIDDYYWVEGYWEQPPELGLLWTPAWWGWDDGAYRFHEGYWGREVGWYGGINYGYGYHGHGWEGGRWEGGHLAYNRAAINITNVHVTNVYYQRTTVINNYGPRTSYSGGAGGIQARPTPREWRATQAPHIPPNPTQIQRLQQAASNPNNVAARVTPGWTPPPVHRVGTDGTPIPRAAAIAHGNATFGAPPQYQRPATSYGAPPQPGATGTPPRPTWQNQTAPGYAPPPRSNPQTGYTPPTTSPTPAPGYRYAPPPRSNPAPSYTPPPSPPPAPNAYHPQPQPQFHPAPPPPPAPPPKPAPPPPPPKAHDHDHP